MVSIVCGKVLHQKVKWGTGGVSKEMAKGERRKAKASNADTLYA